MKSLSVGALAVAAAFCVTPVSLRICDHQLSTAVVLDTAHAADLGLEGRPRVARRAYYGRLYDPYCNGPYTGGGWTGGTYYGGPWILLHCYGISHLADAPVHYAPVNHYGYYGYYGYDYGYAPGFNYGYAAGLY